MLLWSWKQFCASLDGSVRLEMLLCSWKRFYASLDESVRLEMLLCSWKQFYASLDGSVRREKLLSSWKQFYVTLDKSAWQETLIYSWKRFYTSLDESVLQGILFSDLLLAGTPLYPPNSLSSGLTLLCDTSFPCFPYLFLKDFDAWVSCYIENFCSRQLQLPVDDAE